MGNKVEQGDFEKTEKGWTDKEIKEFIQKNCKVVYDTTKEVKQNGKRNE
jgi:transposase